MKATFSFLMTGMSLCLQCAAQTDSTVQHGTSARSIGEVVVSAGSSRYRQHIESTQMGKAEIPVALLMKAPSIGGEKDVIKSLQLTPGVKRGTEGGIGMYVRGGGNDENLILLDGAPVYNAGHLLGFFSVFNSTVVRDVQLYKSSFPVQYGGRLSSVMDVRTADGSFTDHHASGTLGLISSSAAYSGPLIKDRLSVSVAGRRTYIDKILKDVPYNFYDLNGRLTFLPDKCNRLTLSGYKGDDVLRLQQDSKDTATGLVRQLKTGMNLGNTTASLHWLYDAPDGRLTSDVLAYTTRFRYDIKGTLGATVLNMRSAIRDYGLKATVHYKVDDRHRLTGGISLINHYFNPNIVHADGGALEQVQSNDGHRIYTNEAAVFVADELRVSDKLQINAGLRFSGALVTDAAYFQAEPRLALRYKLDERHSVKASYARMAQYMHLVSSSSVAMPTDLWYPVTKTIKPGYSDQWSIGYYQTLPQWNLTLSAEAYYKAQHQLVEYKEGAQLLLNDRYEQELVHGKGRACGIELLATRTAGRFTGWLGYSLSYAGRTFDSLNKGREYAARYDRRHDCSLVGAFELNKKCSFSSSILYATGSPFTGQTGQYMVPNPGFTDVDVLPAYTGRNAVRFSASFRVDVDFQYRFRIGKKFQAESHLSIYNVMNRTQPGRVERTYNETTKEYSYQQKGLFGLIPAASLNVKF